MLLVVVALAMTMFGVASAPAHCADENWEFFEVNAQYRGSMKKGFDSLGCAVGYFLELEDGRGQVILHACVRDPEKQNEYYSFRVNMVFTAGDRFAGTDTEVYAQFDGIQGEHQQQIKDMVLLLALIRCGKVQQLENSSFHVNRTDLRIEGKRTGRVAREYMVWRSGKPPIEGKFFLQDDRSGMPKLEKFRFKRDKVSISFVVAPAAQIQAKYGALAPYASIVFNHGGN